MHTHRHGRRPSRLLAGAALAALALSCAAPSPIPATPEADRAVRSAWLGLPATANGCPEHYDYFPEGGLAIFYCHARPLLSLERLEALAGMPSTRAARTSPALAAAFRHYDPRFVEWLRGALLPARRDASFRVQTQPIYDRLVAPLARQFLTVRRVMLARRPWTSAEVRWVRQAIEAGRLPERYYATRYLDFGPAPGGDPVESGPARTAWDPNVGPTAVAFWIRRELDGSAPAFTAALEELVAIYDPAWLRAGAGVEVLPAAAPRPPAPRPAAAEPTWEPTPVDPGQRVCGTVRERLKVAPYVYLRLTGGEGEHWVALPWRDVAQGEQVCAGDLTVMTNFRSTQLRRTFPEIHFGREVGREGGGATGPAPSPAAAPATPTPIAPGEDEVLAEGVGLRITAGEFLQVVATMKPEARRRFGTKRALLDALVGTRLMVREARRRELHRRPALAGADDDRLMEALMEQHAQIELDHQPSEEEVRAFVARELPGFVERLRAEAKVRVDEAALVRVRVP